MNAAVKIKIARYFFMAASAATLIQTLITAPPYTPEQVTFWTGTLTLVALVATVWKNYLSPEISNTAGNVALTVAIAATLTGILDYMKILHFSDVTGEKIKWWITVIITLFNFFSKDIFPSEMQKDRTYELKKQ